MILGMVFAMTYGRALFVMPVMYLFVRTDRPDHSHCNEKFTFNQIYPARSIKS